VIAIKAIHRKYGIMVFQSLIERGCHSFNQPLLRVLLAVRAVFSVFVDGLSDSDVGHELGAFNLRLEIFTSRGLALADDGAKFGTF
jgi:hypothetical protein